MLDEVPGAWAIIYSIQCLPSPQIHLPSETGRRRFTAFGHPTSLGSLHLIWAMWILLISKALGGTASDWAGEGLVISIAFH